MASGTTNDWWKYTATGLAGAVLSGAIGFVSLWTVGLYRWTTEEQVRSMLQTDSPYVHEHQTIKDRITRAETGVSRLEQKFDLILAGQADIKTDVALIRASVVRLDKDATTREAERKSNDGK